MKLTTAPTLRKALLTFFTIIFIASFALALKAFMPVEHASAWVNDPDPKVDLHVPNAEFPSKALIGEKFEYIARVYTDGTKVGYSPYLRLILPENITIKDPAQDVVVAGICSNPPCPDNSGYPITADFVGKFTGGALPDAEFIPSSSLDAQASGPLNGEFWRIKLPIGSIYPAEKGVLVKIKLYLKDTAKLGQPLPVCHEPVLKYDSVMSQSIKGQSDCPDVIPAVAILTKRALNYPSNKKLPDPPVETPTGSCLPMTFALEVDIADNVTLIDLKFDDILPNEMVFVPGSVQFAGVAGGVQTHVTNNTNASGGGTLTIWVNNDEGQSKDETGGKPDVTVYFQAYVKNILSVSSCSSQVIVNTATLDALIGGADPMPQEQAALPIEVKHVALQKSAIGPDPLNPMAVVPEDKVNYTLTFEVSQGINVNKVQIADCLPDGILLTGQPMISLNNGPLTPINPSSSQGCWLFDLSTATLPACTTGKIVYQGVVQQSYTNSAPVLASDELTNAASINYSITNKYGAQGCIDDAYGKVVVSPIRLWKSIVNPQPEYLPGDVVTFRLKMELPSGDTQKAEFTDYLPLPVFKVNQAFGFQVISSTNSIVIPANFQKDTLTNSIKVTFPSTPVISTNSNSTTNPKRFVEVEFKIPVTTDPYPDDLYLTNLVYSSSSNTANEAVNHLAGVVLHARAPKLDIVKGVYETTNPYANAQSVLPSQSSPVNNNVTGVDTGDIITFYLTVTNNGGAPAYGVLLKDDLPPCLSYVGYFPANGSPTPFKVTPSGQTILATYTGTTPLPPGQSWVLAIQARVDCLQPCQTPLTNKGSMNWSSHAEFEDLGVWVTSPQFGWDKSDTATVTPASPAVTKGIVKPRSGYVVGQTLKYFIQVRIPEYTFNNVTLVDNLPGMAGVDPTVTATVDAGLSISGSANCGAPTNSGKTIQCNFGQVKNLNTDNANRYITVYFTAVVLNEPGNAIGVTRTNAATLTTNECGSQFAYAQPFTVIEPMLKVTKTASQSTGDAGDVITWTVTVQNVGFGGAVAYDVNLKDQIEPNSGVFVPSSLQSTGPMAVGLTGGLGSWGIQAIASQMGFGETEVIKFKTVLEVAAPCQQFTNTAIATWASLPLSTPTPISQHNLNSCPRTGPPGLCGAPNNYITSGTATVATPGPTITKALVDTSAPHTTGSQVTIGETATYDITVCLPEGSTPSITVADNLPANLKFLSAKLNIKPASMYLGGKNQGDPLPAGPWTFSPVNLPGNNDTSDNCFTIRVTAQVRNSSLNSGLPPQTNITNIASVTTKECGTIKSNPVTITVVEPKLTMVKKFNPNPVQTGQTVTVTLTITNTGTSEAFDLSFVKDTLASSLVINTVISTKGNPSSSGGEVIVVGIGSFKPGETMTVVITATVRGECAVIPNTAMTSQYSSLPAAVTGERGYDGATGTDYLVVTGPKCSCVKPEIEIPPVDQSFCGTMGTATFTAVAAGSAPIAKQWQFSSDGISWSNYSSVTISSTTTASTTLTTSTLGYYRAVFTNSCGTVTTTAASLKFFKEPCIVAQ